MTYHSDDIELSDDDRKAFRKVAEDLALNVEEIADAQLVRVVLGAPGGEKQLVASDADVHPAPRALFRMLAREDGFVDSGPDWIGFNSDDAYIEARAKRGQDPLYVLRIDAYLLSTTDARPTEKEVRDWVADQPKPHLGLLDVGSRERQDGSVEHLPVLQIESTVDSGLGDFLYELMAPFAEAWDNRSRAIAVDSNPFGLGAIAYRVGDPTAADPKNAWLLMGSEASYPSQGDIELSSVEAEAGIYDRTWTAPKNGERGDLALIYFTAPRKAACFVARLASDPFWHTDVQVAADRTIDPHQWWSYLSAMVEIEPLSYETLQEAHNGYLPLRGRSGHYLSPATIATLQFRAVRSDEQIKLDRIVRVPAGNTELPEPEATTFEQWRDIPAGVLPLEAKVSEHVVGPLQHLVYGPGREWTRGVPDLRIEAAIGPVVVPEYRLQSGYVDFLFMYPASTPALAVEVKLSMTRPPSGLWLDSPDFQQLRRYMDELGTPGLLVDAQRLLLVKPGASAPYTEVVRARATWDDIALIRDLLIEGGCDTTDQAIPTSKRTPMRRVARRGGESGNSKRAVSSQGRTLEPLPRQDVVVREESQWVAEYDYERRGASLTLFNTEDLIGQNWSGIDLLDSLSDPAGRFQVFGTTDARTNDEARTVVKIVAKLDDNGALLTFHPDFVPEFMGSATIWPYKPAGIRFGLIHWLSWPKGWPFIGHPRSWGDAHPV